MMLAAQPGCASGAAREILTPSTNVQIAKKKTKNEGGVPDTVIIREMSSLSLRCRKIGVRPRLGTGTVYTGSSTFLPVVIY